MSPACEIDDRNGAEEVHQEKGKSGFLEVHGILVSKMKCEGHPQNKICIWFALVAR
jgi:hypothetical protein